MKALKMNQFRGKTEHKEKMKLDLLYIMAPSYTGSTLLTFLLASHPSVSTVGELKASSMGNIDQYICSCGSLLKECRFWERVQSEMMKEQKMLSFDNFGTHFRSEKWILNKILCSNVKNRIIETVGRYAISFLPGCKKLVSKIIEQNIALMKIICRLQKGYIFMDGSKDPNRLIHLINSGHFNTKVIYLIRDGRGAASSYMKHHKVTMEVAAKEWDEKHKECEQVLKKLNPNDIIQIHYENMCKEPIETMNSICKFLNIKEFNGAIELSNSEKHILGNIMRLRNAHEISIDEKWKTSLSQSDINEFHKIAADTNARYGYK
jgi:hypothetical protein